MSFLNKTLQILVADDEEDLLVLIEEYLKISFKDAHIFKATNGAEALELAKSTKFDIICTDQKMPILSGSEFVNVLRVDESHLNYNTPILFITSFPDDVVKSMKHSKNIFYLSKPFKTSNLFVYVDTVMVQFTLDLLNERDLLAAKQSDLQKQQSQLIQSARMASYREFGANVAHELNNPLAIIEGLAYLILNENEPQNTAKHARKIIGNIERIKKVVTGLRNFSSEDLGEKRSPVNINQVISNAILCFKSRLHDSNIATKLVKAHNPQLVYANFSLLERVFQILIQNSIEAFERNATITDKVIQIITSNKSAGILEIAFTDNAGGVSDNIADKLFQPFTSTKMDVAGAGFGLATAYGVIKRTGGQISVLNHAGKGTQFTIELPSIDAKHRDSPANSGKDKKASSKQIVAKKEVEKSLKDCVLIVDDEVELCDLLHHYLEEAFEVQKTSSPWQALDLVKTFNFNLILTDYKMPDMDGVELINKIHATHPLMKFVLISGHATTVDNLGFLGPQSHLILITKPFGEPKKVQKQLLDFLSAPPKAK